MSNQKLALNIGSGQRPFHSTPDIRWVNIDSQSKWNPDLVCDGSRLPYPQGIVDMVVLHHVLEHFGCGESASLIREIHRVLIPGGSLIITVPNMDELARGWMTGRITTQVYLTNVYGAYMGDEADRHKWGFDRPSLMGFLLECAEWELALPFDWREIPGADIARDWWILGVECRK